KVDSKPQPTGTAAAGADLGSSARPATGSAAPVEAAPPLPGSATGSPATASAPRQDSAAGPEPADARAADVAVDRDERTAPTNEPVAGRPDIGRDPATAEAPARAWARPSPSEDEAANAPRTAAEVDRRAAERDRRVPQAPVRTTTLAGAVQLIKEGKREQALASLRELWKKTPASAYIPFLLGNLYFEQRWWSVALEHYAAAIKKNARYRSNP